MLFRSKVPLVFVATILIGLTGWILVQSTKAGELDIQIGFEGGLDSSKALTSAQGFGEGAPNAIDSPFDVSATVMASLSEQRKASSASSASSGASAFVVRVENASGDPVAGCWVAAREGERQDLWPVVPKREQFVAMTRTGEDGVAELIGMPENGDLEIGVWGRGLELQSKLVSAAGEAANLKFGMQRGRDVALRVVDHRGDPVADAEVRLQIGDPSRFHGGCVVDFWGPVKPVVRENGFYRGYAQKAKTDSKGEIHFASVPFGAGEIRWRHRGYVNSGDLILSAYATTTTIEADPGVIVYPRIVKADGAPFLGARVMVASQPKMPQDLEDADEEDLRITASRDLLDDKWVDAVVRNKTGEIELTGLPETGWYYLQIEYWGVLFDTPWRRVEDRRPLIKMPPFHEIRGRFRSKQNLPEDWYTELATRGGDLNTIIDQPRGDEIVTRADGSFVFILDPSQPTIELSMNWNDFLSYDKTLSVTTDVDLGDIWLPPKNWKRVDWVGNEYESDILIQ